MDGSMVGKALEDCSCMESSVLQAGGVENICRENLLRQHMTFKIGSNPTE